jgi:hypothetical protein
MSISSPALYAAPTTIFTTVLAVAEPLTADVGFTEKSRLSTKFVGSLPGTDDGGRPISPALEDAVTTQLATRS